MKLWFLHTDAVEQCFVQISEVGMAGTREHAKTISPRVYDWLSRVAGVGDAHWQLVAQAAIGAGATVLEIGVGAGNVLLKVKCAVPAAIAFGLDVSTASLATAARKAARTGVELQLDQGDALNLPYPDAAMDRVLSSFVFHHIPDDQKFVALSEIRRVLKPNGSLHLLDFIANSERNGRRHDRGPRRLDPVELMAQAGLAESACVGEGASRLGRHAYYRASR